MTIYDTFYANNMSTSAAANAVLFLHPTASSLVVATVARAVTIKTIVRFYNLFFPLYHAMYLLYFMIIIAIKITNIILLLLLEWFPVVNPRRDDSDGKIDKIIFLATCLPIIFTHTRLRERRF